MVLLQKQRAPLVEHITVVAAASHADSAAVYQPSVYLSHLLLAASSRSLEHPSEAISLFIPKYFWSELCVFIIYFSPTNLPSLRLAFCHPMMPCQ